MARAGPGRIIGYGCLPASLAEICGLRDIRGYDSVDPARLVDVLDLAKHPASPFIAYAVTQWLIPRVHYDTAGQLELSPVLDMLNVRYVIFRSRPNTVASPAFQASDYWVLENHSALPRVYVPQTIELVSDPKARLKKMASPQFDARQVAYVESPVQVSGSCSGTAEITAETPTHLTIAVRTETSAMVVIADLWDKGWRAWFDGTPVPILRANHAIRGVVVPAGNGTLEMRYSPASLNWGLGLAGFATAILLTWAGWIAWNRRRPKYDPAAASN
jgi:hypothetical protein